MATRCGRFSKALRPNRLLRIRFRRLIPSGNWFHHLDAWCKFANGAVQGIPIPGWPDMPVEQDFPQVIDKDPQAWKQALQSLFANHLKLVEAIKRFGDARLETTVPGRPYKFYRLFQSATQHAVYHAGQIALLKKVLRSD